MDAKSIISLFLLGVIQKVRSLRRGGGGGAVKSEKK